MKRVFKGVLILTLILLFASVFIGCASSPAGEPHDQPETEGHAQAETVEPDNHDSKEKDEQLPSNSKDFDDKETEEENAAEVEEKEATANVNKREKEESSKTSVEKEEKKNEEASEPLIDFTIHGPVGEGKILETTQVELKEDDTVLDILIRVTRANRIHMDFRGRGAGAYVEGIDNLYEFDKGPKSGWMYSINGRFPNRGAGVWTVGAGDHIEWKYTEDLGSDIGGGVEDGLWDGKED